MDVGDYLVFLPPRRFIVRTLSLHCPGVVTRDVVVRYRVPCGAGSLWNAESLWRAHYMQVDPVNAAYIWVFNDVLMGRVVLSRGVHPDLIVNTLNELVDARALIVTEHFRRSRVEAARLGAEAHLVPSYRPAEDLTPRVCPRA